MSIVLDLPATFWWLFVIAAVVSALGWARTQWFFTVGYAWAMVAMTLFTLAVHGATLGPSDAAQLFLVGTWGLRLGMFLVNREQTVAWSKRPRAGRVPLPLVAKIGMWVMATLLYPLMFAPAFFAAMATELDLPWAIVTWVGIGVMLIGLVIEGVADAYKSHVKNRDTNALVSKGLFGWVRYPNYLGEMMFWAGNLLAGMFSMFLVPFFIGLFGLACTVFIMMSAAKRLDGIHNKRYGDRPEYRQWVASVPALVPGTKPRDLAKMPLPDL